MQVATIGGTGRERREPRKHAPFASRVSRGAADSQVAAAVSNSAATTNPPVSRTAGAWERNITLAATCKSLRAQEKTFIEKFVQKLFVQVIPKMSSLNGQIAFTVILISSILLTKNNTVSPLSERVARSASTRWRLCRWPAWPSSSQHSAEQLPVSAEQKPAGIGGGSARGAVCDAERLQRVIFRETMRRSVSPSPRVHASQ